jgi:50S ribosomal subunit-associated GTPase HflX
MDEKAMADATGADLVLVNHALTPARSATWSGSWSGA